MKEWFFPTSKNRYRAKLISVPGLTLIMLALLLTNSGILGFAPRAISAAISSSELLQSHNQERAKAGLGPLTYSPVLSSSAQRKAVAMLESDCWSHFCPNGKSPWDFFIEAGYDYLYAGENLAEGFFDPGPLMVAWMNSETHKANVLRAAYTEVGFGIVQGNFQGNQNSTVVVVHFGTPTQEATVLAGSFEAPLPAPVITSPTNGQMLNGSEVLVAGTAQNAQIVELFESGDSWISLDASQGIFTYRAPALVEGTYNIQARSIAGQSVSSLSNTVEFSVDRTPDPVSPFSINLLQQGRGNPPLLQVTQPNLSSMQISLGSNNQLELQQVSSNLWQIELLPQQLQSMTSAMFTTTDLAGNMWLGEVDLGKVVNQLDLLPLIELQIEQELAQTEVLRSQVNLALLVLLFVLFIADFLILQYTGKSATNRKPHMHISLLIVVVLVVLTGSYLGYVGQGINV